MSDPAPAHSRARAVRTVTGALLVGVIALGILTRRVPLGFSLWDKSAGDALYAVMIYGLVVLLRPTAKPIVLGTLAIAICVAIELFQLTAIPRAAPRVVQIVLGTTFAWHDVACYVVGGLVAAGIHRRFSRVVSGRAT